MYGVTADTFTFHTVQRRLDSWLAITPPIATKRVASGYLTTPGLNLLPRRYSYMQAEFVTTLYWYDVYWVKPTVVNGRVWKAMDSWFPPITNEEYCVSHDISKHHSRRFCQLSIWDVTMAFTQSACVRSDSQFARRLDISELNVSFVCTQNALYIESSRPGTSLTVLEQYNGENAFNITQSWR